MQRAITDDRLRELRTMPYAEYLQTAEWRRRRDRALARALWTCEWPGCRSKVGLEVHHKTYEHRGDELDQELAVLCGDHHEQFHTTYGQHAGRGDVRLVVIRDVMRRCRYHSISDFVAVLKDAFAAYGLVSEPAELHQLIAHVEAEIELDVPPSQPPAELQVDDAPAFDQREARELLLQLGVTTIRTMRDLRELSAGEVQRQQFEARRAKAMKLVLNEILVTESRIVALEKDNQ